MRNEMKQKRVAQMILYVALCFFYALDDSILDVDVGVDRLVVIHNPPSFDQQLVTLREEYREREGENQS